MNNIIWWGIVFIPSNAMGFMKMRDGSCQNIYTENGEVVDQSQPLEYTCISMDVPSPAWYNAETDQP